MQTATCQKIAPFSHSTELWQVGILHRPIGSLLAPDALNTARITWLPDPGNFRFLADPFGLWRDGLLTIFVEAFDYRTKHGEIHYYQYDGNYQLVKQGLALRTATHLSYPSLIEHAGEIYMLPEAHKSGRLTLYRAARFPDKWEPVATLLDLPAIDASVIHHAGRWWMFYSLPGAKKRAMRELYVAHADTLLGPWMSHSKNPIRIGGDSSRPGGTPFVQDGQLYLPMQDCTEHYGEAINVLRIDTLTPTSFAATAVQRLIPNGLHDSYRDGLHTLSACGEVTLIDLKHVDHSPARRWINLERRLRRALRIV